MARLWTWIRADSAVAPAAIAALRTGREAILGILIPLATPSFLVHGGAGGSAPRSAPPSLALLILVF